MKTTKQLMLLALLLVPTVVYADHNDIRLDLVVRSLPEGWTVTFSSPNHFDSCGNKALFEAEFVLPTVEYTANTKAGPMTLHPSFTLMFHSPFSKQQEEAFGQCVDRIREVPRAVAPPHLFVKTENYWVFAYSSVDSVGHPLAKDLYLSLQAMLAVNRKQ